MKVSNHAAVPVYTVSGSSSARPLPEWLARKRKRSLKSDPEFASRIELLQDFEFEEASQCIRVSDDGQWVMSTGMRCMDAWGCFCVNWSSSATDDLLQAHTNLRFILTTYPTSRFRTLAIQMPSTPLSSFSPQITPSLYICRLIALLNSIPLVAATTPPDYLAMAET